MNQVIPLNSKPRVSFLMIGRSGAGKTTLINAFVNHLNRVAYPDSKKVLIPQRKGEECSFPEYAKAFDLSEIESGEDGQAKTQNFHSYFIETDEKEMIIMDTPGLGDPRGFETDKEHMEKIINGIKETGFLQAVIFVLDPENRTNQFVKYYIDEIRKIMTKSCIKQSIIVFTKSYGDVTDEVKNIFTQKLDLNIPEERIFIIENNPLFEKPKTENKSKQMSGVWDEGSETFNKIYDLVSSFELIPTKEVESLFECRRMIEEKIEQKMATFVKCQELRNKIEELLKQEEERKNESISFYNEEKASLQAGKSARETNYNCRKCLKTCVENTSTRGYALGCILTLSLYHWISENVRCRKCSCLNKDHTYETIRFFAEPDATTKKIMEHIEEEIRVEAKEKERQESNLAKLDKISTEALDKIAELTKEVNKLGVIGVVYDSFLNYLDWKIKSNQNSQEQIELLVKDRERYRRMVQEIGNLEQ